LCTQPAPRGPTSPDYRYQLPVSPASRVLASRTLGRSKLASCNRYTKSVIFQIGLLLIKTDFLQHGLEPRVVADIIEIGRGF